jgi:hypothetical protein
MISIPREVIRHLATAVEHAGVSDDAGVLSGKPSKAVVADVMRLSEVCGIDCHSLFATAASASAMRSAGATPRTLAIATN